MSRWSLLVTSLTDLVSSEEPELTAHVFRTLGYLFKNLQAPLLEAELLACAPSTANIKTS